MLLVIFLLKKQKNSEEVRKAQKTGKEGREITASHDSKCNKEKKKPDYSQVFFRWNAVCNKP